MDSYFLEPPNAIRAKDDYYGMGPSRSLERLLAHYKTFPADEVPTQDGNTLAGWSAKYSWIAYCAEREASLAEKTEAILQDSRIAMKQARIEDQKAVISVSRMLIDQCAEYFRGFHKDVVSVPKSVKEDGETTYEHTIQLVPNIAPNDFIKIFPKAVAALIAAQKEQKQELGEDTERFHVTVEQVVNALPAPLQGPIREALYEELMSPAGLDRL